jgi:hypothetical protein
MANITLERLALAEKFLLEANKQMAWAGFLESPWMNYRGEMTDEMYDLDNELGYGPTKEEK